MLGMTGLQSARAGEGRQRWPDNSVIGGTRGNAPFEACCLPCPGRSYALCADVTITTASSWPVCRFGLAPDDDRVAHECMRSGPASDVIFLVAGIIPERDRKYLKRKNNFAVSG